MIFSKTKYLVANERMLGAQVPVVSHGEQPVDGMGGMGRVERVMAW